MNLTKDFVCPKEDGFTALDYYSFINSYGSLSFDKLNECTKYHSNQKTILWDHNGLLIPINKKEKKKLDRLVKEEIQNAKRNEYKIQRLVMMLKSESFDEQKLYLIKDALKEYSGILPRLIEACAYYKLGKVNRSEVLLKAIMNKEFHSYLLGRNISTRDFLQKKDQFFSVMEQLLLKRKKSKTINAFLYYIYSNSSGKFKKEFGDKFKIEDNIDQIRKYANSSYERMKFPFVWGPVVFNRFSRTEYISFLETSLISKRLSKCSGCLLFFRDLHTISRSDKAPVLKSFYALKKNKDSYSKEVHLRLLEDGSFYKLLKANSKQKHRPLFQLKREYYRWLIKKNINREYAIFQLALLGDFPKENLLKVMAMHSVNK